MSTAVHDCGRRGAGDCGWRILAFLIAMLNSKWQASPSKIHDKLDALTKSLHSKTITWLLNVDSSWMVGPIPATPTRPAHLATCVSAWGLTKAEVLRLDAHPQKAVTTRWKKTPPSLDSLAILLRHGTQSRSSLPWVFSPLFLNPIVSSSPPHIGNMRNPILLRKVIAHVISV